ncbi:MAG: TetR/AcrR family transcriptional regulator [Ignavibacteriota bacterium]
MEAIFEATISGFAQPRRGPPHHDPRSGARRVSVGTLYQYYPNKQSLLFAVLENHLDKVAVAVGEIL